MPHTVRPTSWATNLATSAVNVLQLGAVKHGRNISNTRDTDTGRVTSWSIGAPDQKRTMEDAHNLAREAWAFLNLKDA